ncbi:MAG: flagellar hook assembly protein FlgD [Alphaproteobacteria bacterium]
MTIYSALNTQSLAASNQVEIETKSTAEIAREDAQKQKTDFLLLLLTQLENQNPLDPMDTNEYTAQLTRYSILEQGIDTNANLTETNEYLKSNVNNTMLGYVGETVEVSSNTASVQGGEARWSYEVLGNADEVDLTFLNEDGDIIHTEDGATGFGVHDVSFDAATHGLSNGVPAEIVIAARDADGKVLEQRVSAYAKVDGVWTDGDNNYLTAGGVSYRFDDVLKISELAAATTTTTTP